MQKGARNYPRIVSMSIDLVMLLVCAGIATWASTIRSELQKEDLYKKEANLNKSISDSYNAINLSLDLEYEISY